MTQPWIRKREIVLIAVLAVAALIAAVFFALPKQHSGVTVRIEQAGKLVQTFDPAVDAVYHIEGSCGGLDVEVKNGQWHVINEQCPNHICAEMGWRTAEDVIPVTCMPNEIVIYVGERE